MFLSTIMPVYLNQLINIHMLALYCIIIQSSTDA